MEVGGKQGLRHQNGPALWPKLDWRPARGPGLCPYSFVWEFIEEFFKLGNGRWIEQIALHACTEGDPDSGHLRGNLQRVGQIARRYGPDRDLYITALGWSTTDVTERQQVQYLVRADVLCLVERGKLLTWHDLWQYLPGDEASYAILRPDMSPRPALVAYANLVRQLQRAQYVREVPGLGSTQRGFVSSKDDRAITVLWDCGEKPTPVRLPHVSGDCRAEDIMGRPRRIHRDNRGDATLELNGDPIFATRTLAACCGWHIQESVIC